MDLPDTFVRLVVAQPSHLVILFSGTAVTNYHPCWIVIRAVVLDVGSDLNDKVYRHHWAWPAGAYMTGSSSLETVTFHFTMSNVSAGSHYIKMQWKVNMYDTSYGGDRPPEGEFQTRALTVIALPEE
jgi:hypothetical protein